MISFPLLVLPLFGVRICNLDNCGCSLFFISVMFQIRLSFCYALSRVGRKTSWLSFNFQLDRWCLDGICYCWSMACYIKAFRKAGGASHMNYSTCYPSFCFGDWLKMRSQRRCKLINNIQKHCVPELFVYLLLNSLVFRSHPADDSTMMK